jgi:GTPase involved in cell partitioning and DNA repair
MRLFAILFVYSYEWMFFDVAKINVQGGDGGNGCMAMRREFRVAFGGPR